MDFQDLANSQQEVWSTEHSMSRKIIWGRGSISVVVAAKVAFSATFAPQLKKEEAAEKVALSARYYMHRGIVDLAIQRKEAATLS